MREFSNTTAVPIRLVSGAAVVFFAPGQTRPLPDALVEAALDAGLVEVGGNTTVSAVAVSDAGSDTDARDEAPSLPTIEFDKFALWRAFDAIAADGDKRLFNKDGTPKLREVKRLYGQPGLTREIVDAEWRQYRGTSE